MTARLERTGRAAALRVAGRGYGPVMAPRRPNTPNDLAEAATPGEPYDPVAEQEEARRVRRRRDDELTPAERLERLHHLCAQLATMTRARDPE